MSRIMFVVPPFTGHINPTLAVGAELTRRGHDVAWAGHPALLESLLPEGALAYPVSHESLDARLRANRERRLALRGAAAMKYLWEEVLIPLAWAMLPGVEAAVASFAPDVVVADQQALAAGAVAARRAGLVWATSATTPAELLRPLVWAPKVTGWVNDQVTAFQLACGIASPVDVRFSDRLILVFTTSALMGDISGFGDHYAFTGPALGRPERGSFPWEWLDPKRRHLLVSLGTVNVGAGGRFFHVVIEALAGLGEELQVVIVAPPIGSVPPHILVTSHVPQLALLPRMSAVVSHGGNNTLCESLAHGLPLVVTPVTNDQPITAQQVAGVGAAIRLSFTRVRAAELRDAIRAVLDDPSYRNAACRVRDSFTAAGGTATAADRLEALT